MKRYKMVMFDMDGTIIDSHTFHAICYQRFMKQRNITMTIEQLKKMMGNTIKTILTNAIHEEQRDEALRDLSKFYLTEVDDLIDQLQIIAGSEQTIAKIKEKGLWVTLLTNSKKELVERIIIKKDFERLFDMVEAADNDSLDKYLRCQKIIKTFQIQPSDILYVGDSQYDVYLAKEIGMTGCLMYNNTSWMSIEGIPLESVSPNIVINDIVKVIDLL